MQKYTNKNILSVSFLLMLKKCILWFLMIYLSTAVVAVCTLFLNNCQFIQFVNNWPFSSIEWEFCDQQKVLTEVFVWKVWSAPALILSQVSTQHFLISISSRGVWEEVNFSNNRPIRILDGDKLTNQRLDCSVNLLR